MAVMTTQQPEGVAVEQKIQPVPSSDKMALDLDINGTTNRDETVIKSAPPNAALTKYSATSPSDHATVNSKALDVNGTANDDAFSANQAIPTPPIEPISEPHRIEETSPSAPNSSQFPDTNTTTTEVRKLSISSDAQQADSSATPIATDFALDTAVEDVSATSTVPPVVDVDAEESDRRHSETSPPPAIETQPLADLDFNFGPDREQDSFSDNRSLETHTQAQIESLDNALPDLPDSVVVDGLGPSEVAQVEAATREQERSTAQSATTAAQPPVDDTSMHDVPMDDHPPESQAPKVARERDEDGDDHLPSAKRTKTEELNEPRAESSEGVPYQNGDGPAGPSDAPPMTDYERKEYSKIVKNATRTNSGKNFKDPVTLLWPALAEGYLAKIAHPVDLGLIDRKLKGNSYANLQEFKADFNLIYDNCVTFNSADHEVTRSARVLRDNVFEKIRSIPPPPAPAVKKEKKQKPTPDPAVRAAASRRRSKETAPKPVQPATPAAPTFALDPTTNTPLIRRDSTKNQDGGRPKREIHPPKNKDLPYSAVKPKNKKFATELKFCDDVLGELKKPKHWAMNSVFAEPVDPVALNIPNYFTVIKLPMDLRTIQGKLDEGQYGSAKDFEKDMRLMITNCLKFNPAGNPIHQIGVDFQNLFGSLWANKEKWVAEHSPAVASPSPPPESEEDESEDDEEQDAAIAAGGQSAAAARLIEEQQKLIDLMTAKKKDQAQIAIQQSMIEVLKQAVASSQAVPKRQKKAKAPKAKKAATVKKDKVPVKRAGNKLQSRYMGTIEKEVISAGLSSLPDEIANEVLTLIKQDQQGVDVGDDGTLELDIDVVSNHVLWKIHDLIMTYAPAVDASIREAMQEREVPRAPAKPVSKKKNKPMNKDDQEKNIEILQNRLKDFDRQGSGSQEPVMQTTERHDQDDSSGDDDSDSEEE